MRNTGGCALIAGSVVLLIGAIAINSTALFLMATALGVMILTCRLQAWLAVRGLRLDRQCPAFVNIGDNVTVRIGVTSDFGYKRPLVTVSDDLPSDMGAGNLSPSLPIAPSHESPVNTQYQFEAKRRGRFHWSSLTVQGSDALGLVRMKRRYRTGSSELLVLPVPVPFEVRLPFAAGWGFSESDFGRSRGQGIEPRGVREYSDGDSQRYIHWRSSARTSQLMVKEFETGSLAKAYLFIQRTYLQSVWAKDGSAMDRICGNAAYLVDSLLTHGAEVALPSLLDDRGSIGIGQRHELLAALATVSFNQEKALGEEIGSFESKLTQGSTLYIFLVQPDPSLAPAITSLGNRGIKTIAILYNRFDDKFTSSLQSAGATIQFEARHEG